MPNIKVLIVDDDKNICELLRLYLEKEGYATQQAYNGEVAFAMFEESTPSLVLLDIMMPKQDGWETCRKMRAISEVPIIMLTAKGDTFDKVLGLELGADDYIVKPFDTKEVVARIKAVLRRTQRGAKQAQGGGKRIAYQNLELDLNKYQLKVSGKTVEAPPKEMELLFFLASHPNRVFTRDQLLDEVWGFEFFGDSRTIDVHIKRLREKINGACQDWGLATVWSVGYKFEVRD